MSMADLLRETRASLPDVQEALEALRRRRCLIEQTPGGVSLVSTGLACWQDVLEEIAKEKSLRIGRQVKVFAKTGSTNDVAWQFSGIWQSEPRPSGSDRRRSSPTSIVARSLPHGRGSDHHRPLADGLIVLADEQTAGRGRLGHAWSAKAEQSILMSVLLKEREGEGGGEMERLTLLAGLAAAEAVEGAASAVCRMQVRIKWPNDLLVDGRKLAGILVERRTGYIVVGVGINVAQGNSDFPAEVAARATSIYQASGMQMDRLRLVTALMNRLDHLCGNAVADDQWLTAWKSRCGMFGTQITAKSAGCRVSGEVVDVDPLKGLVIRSETGGMMFLSSQTTTLAE